MKNKQLIMMLGAAIFLGIIVFGPALANLQKVIRVNKQQKTELSSLEKKLQILEGIERQWLLRE